MHIKHALVMKHTMYLHTSLSTASTKKEKGKRVHKKSVTDSPAQKGVNISRPTTAFEVR